MRLHLWAVTAFGLTRTSFVTDFVDVQQELFDLPKKVRLVLRASTSIHSLLVQEKVIYNKEVQTTDVSIEVYGPSEDEIRERITREVEAERAAREKELDEEESKLEKEIEDEIRGKPTTLPLSFTDANLEQS